MRLVPDGERDPGFDIVLEGLDPRTKQRVCLVVESFVPTRERPRLGKVVAQLRAPLVARLGPCRLRDALLLKDGSKR